MWQEDKKDVEYWSNFYKQFAEEKPSSFAQFVEDYIPNSKKYCNMLEFGCGNGRDLRYFASKGHMIYGVDLACTPEIGRNYVINVGDFTNLPRFNNVGMIYSRFTMHSVDEAGEDRVLQWVTDNLASDDLFCVEARTIRDSIYGVGVKVAEHTYISDHFRRFIDPVKFLDKMSYSFNVAYFLEDKNLSPYKDENPTLMRIIAKRK